MPSPRRVLIPALSACAAGLLLLALVPKVFGTPQPMIFVAWLEMPAGEREALETRFSLTEARALGAGAFSYVPANTGASTLGALVAHPAVLATDGIDRRTGAISADSLTERRGGILTSPVLARAVKGAGVLLLALGCAFAVAAAAVRTPQAAPLVDWWRMWTAHPGQTARDTIGAVAAWLPRGIPVAAPGAAGLFRIVFMSGVLATVVLEPAVKMAISPADVTAIGGPYGAVVRWMAASPQALAWVDHALRISGALVVAGVLTRWSFAVFVTAFLAWACVFTAGTTLHAVSALQLTLVCLLAAPWADAWSVDAWLQRRRGPPASTPGPTAGRRYGFAMWVPGFVLGVAYLAAAWAKVGHSPAWVLNGTVRQHFLTDLDHAWTGWGPAVTADPRAAIALSAAAVAVEALVISAAFVASTGYRLAIGLCALSLLAGFALFQGIVWPAWWVLLLGFVPWTWLVRDTGPAARAHTDVASRAVTRLQLSTLAGLLILQLGSSIAMRDYRPFLSGYDMYATTHGAEIDNARGRERVRVVTAAGDGWREIPACAVEVAGAPRNDATDTRRAFPAHLTACLDAANAAGPVRLDLDRQTYDWSSMVLRWRERVDVAGPFPRTSLPTSWPFVP